MTSTEPSAEALRLSALDRYDILDTESEQAFDDIVRIASQICDVPIAIVSLVGADRQWFKARVGLPAEGTPRSQSVCAHAIQGRSLFQITDLEADDRTRANPLVTEEPHLRFYAGAVLETPDGHALGTLCVIDTAPRPGGLTEQQAEALLALSRQVMAQLELRRSARAEAANRRMLEATLERLVASEARWRALFGNMREGFLVGELLRDAEGRACDARLMESNGAFLEQANLLPCAMGTRLRELPWGADPALLGQLVRTVETGAPQAFEWRLPDRHRWFEVRSAPEQGDRFSCLVLDITDRKASEQALLLKDERLQMALDASGSVGLWDWPVETNRLTGDARFARLYGLPLDRTASGLTMEEYQEFVVPEDIAPLRERIRAVFEEGADFRVEYRVAPPGRTLRWVECRGRLVRDEEGRPLRFSGTAVDITDRRSREEQKQLLMEELSHRVKNTFAMVQALAIQTLRDADPEASHSLQSRLATLSRAHDVLVQTSWSATTLHRLLDTVLRLETEGARFRLAGNDFSIGSRAALSLSLLLHELATNAVKYGALSREQGLVAIDWRIEDGRFLMRWRESGGPPVRMPAETGFGARLIRMGICGSRHADLRFDPGGLQAEFAADLSMVSED
ncbi:HWE histidine kinase domain-containing protein [Falsiroseomonas tokyonensis]|uniref:histidine kinase n=1 Tax=Falsiroseomonas tokyonensis TaxID=430521 RepID=A0ABV7C0L4_9PROT|nr:HWE histidine kinase domain-containing protein [Falsiroseomonas tokyonensis]MBU8539846.1 PAS domain-containing protein [Falsiroseomonas tokyonensis]